MSIFSNLFGNKDIHSKAKSNISTSWIQLEKISQLDQIVEKSMGVTQVIFKHSTRCGISRSVLRTFESGYNWNSQTLDMYFLDLLKYRDISNEIATRFEVNHESPQLIVIDKGNVVHHASHGAITSEF